MKSSLLVSFRRGYATPSACAFVAIGVFASSVIPTVSFNLAYLKSVTPVSFAFSATLSRSRRSFAMATDSCPASFTVVQIPCLGDNYGYLLHDEESGQTAAIDTPDAKAYQAELQKRGWTLSHILNTHHHWDHTGGNMELKTDNVKIFGSAIEKDKTPGIDVVLQEGDEIDFGKTKAKVIDVGGHTKGHIAYYFPKEAKVFVGDSLFALGCGKMFEGTPTQFWSSLQKLRELPDETMVYCAHEYTTANAKFAVSVEPSNAELVARIDQINDARSRGEPTVPSLLGLEKKTNPFLRCDISNEIRKNVGVSDGDTGAEAFAKVRSAKDSFRG